MSGPSILGELRRTALVVVAAISPLACQREGGSAPASSASGSSAPSARIAVPLGVPSHVPLGLPRSQLPPPPSGPRLAILAGQGIGPIRIGATVATVERHMQARCDHVDEQRCVYVDRAVEVELEGGAARAIVVHRVGRAALGERRYGFFNGAIPPDVSLGMTPAAVQKSVGPPSRVEPVATPGPHGTRERHHYEGMVLEYDLVDPPNLALGSVRITKP